MVDTGSSEEHTENLCRKMLEIAFCDITVRACLLCLFVASLARWSPSLSFYRVQTCVFFVLWNLLCMSIFDVSTSSASMQCWWAFFFVCVNVLIEGCLETDACFAQVAVVRPNTVLFQHMHEHHTCYMHGCAPTIVYKYVVVDSHLRTCA